MTRHNKYFRLAFALALAVTAACPSKLEAQTSGITEININRHVFFQCNATMPVDLYKVMGMPVSPSAGYWGNEEGVPFNGPQSDMPGQPVVNGNIFIPPSDSSRTYVFYFYITAQNEYCGIGRGTVYRLELDVHIDDCIHFSDEPLPEHFGFCYGTLTDMLNNTNHGGNTYSQHPIKISDLLFAFAANPDEWKQDPDDANSDWVPMEVYSDSDSRDSRTQANTRKIGDGGYPIYTKSTEGRGPDSYVTSHDTLYVLIIHPTNGLIKHNVPISIFREEKLEISYSPDIVGNSREFGIEENVVITVDNPELFTPLDGSSPLYKYYLNKKNLNKYYMNGDETQAEITVPALAFSGEQVEDFIEIIARDTNRCMVKYQESVKVNVPFPTVFTPNGDGVNDVLFGGEKFRNREFHLEVFNRWGNRLYYGESGWDGKYQGKDVPPGVYYYSLDVKIADGSVRNISSPVTLIRDVISN